MEGDNKKPLIRRYTAADREVVRRLCCETGFLGQPIDPVFEDRELRSRGEASSGLRVTKAALLQIFETKEDKILHPFPTDVV